MLISSLSIDITGIGQRSRSSVISALSIYITGIGQRSRSSMISALSTNITSCIVQRSRSRKMLKNTQNS